MNATSGVAIGHPGIDFHGILRSARSWIGAAYWRQVDRIVASSVARLGHPGVMADYRNCR